MGQQDTFLVFPGLFSTALTFGLMAFGLLGQGFVPRAEASTVVELSPQARVDLASVIVYGRIVDLTVIEPTEAMPFAMTQYTLSVIECLKGCEAQETITFLTRGGPFADAVQIVTGEAVLAEGETVVVFLERVKRYGNALLPLGLAQGAYVVEAEKESLAGRPRRLRRAPEARTPGEFDLPSSAQHRHTRSDVAPMALDPFLDQIRQRVAVTRQQGARP